MRLLLDEHYAPVIAVQLRERGHDVVAVGERPDIIGLSDHELFRVARSERRAIVTENWADFHRELRQSEASELTHHGVLFTSRTRMPRRKETIGLYVRVLDEFLGRHPSDDALGDEYRWLPDG